MRDVQRVVPVNAGTHTARIDCPVTCAIMPSNQNLLPRHTNPLAFSHSLVRRDEPLRELKLVICDRPAARGAGAESSVARGMRTRNVMMSPRSAALARQIPAARGLRRRS